MDHRQKQALIIFVKAPAPGKVKTRLSPPLTLEQAAQLYRSFARDTWRLARSLKGTRVFIAYDADLTYPSPHWIDPKVLWFPQEGKSLGDRLFNALSRVLCAFPCAVTIGSDSPDLPIARLIDAFRGLEQKQVVLGPAKDGGYYLIGLNQRALQRKIFSKIPWSTPYVLKKTLKILKESGLSFRLLPSHPDVDTGQDLACLTRRLQTNKNQNALIETHRVLKEIRKK